MRFLRSRLLFLVATAHATAPGHARSLLCADVTVAARFSSGHHGIFYGTVQAWAGANGDGIPDLYLTDNHGTNRLYLGDGGGTPSLSPHNAQVALAAGKSSGALFDAVPLDSRWTVRYPDLEIRHADGFESGGTRAWSSVVP